MTTPTAISPGATFWWSAERCRSSRSGALDDGRWGWAWLKLDIGRTASGRPGTAA
ncbi:MULTISPECIES: hypothetical protein [unclassified Methylibium]|uniref:hypothetical protein n=1 Tax=unclassified Methylibium TaxID=2633235 RepID=UPI0003F44502|nr:MULTISPECIES: hypothetical protein [unclassified Methylibium]EWS54837.1 hypothetical protein X551_02359 [Methylibium sp. T29]EWS59379.1 hypothetical protein Y694_02799 [Methylibium sp. T29-B]